ncbi:hypothetical protein AB6N23_15400 [Cellulomonas sp. 179-A 9B4 NHS]|uniref:hypothetical protein n=1 Tax=Cellulomonas sp. 179-A 9B4 NHS TaxID=3142379 RepID=UPI0039A35A65
MTGPAPDDGTATAAAATLARAGTVLGSVVAPATAVSALLFYFGYVSTRAQLAYFGVDVDVLGMATQDYVMRAPQPLLVPTLGLLLLTAALVWADGRLRRWAHGAGAGHVRAWQRALRGIGGTLLGAAGALLLAYPAVGRWPPYALVTPVALGLGALLLARALTWSGADARGAPDGGAAPGTRTTAVVLVLVVVASVFWAAATLAQWSGLGQAKALARDLTRLPAVVVDTTEPLFPADPVVGQTVLAGPDGTATGQRFRYRGLRLLAEGDGRLFLVPERWSPAGSTYVVDPDDARVRFRFVDDPP